MLAVFFLSGRRVVTEILWCFCCNLFIFRSGEGSFFFRAACGCGFLLRLWGWGRCFFYVLLVSGSWSPWFALFG